MPAFVNESGSRPYLSWERGANENTNGLIRQYIPKGSDFTNITQEFLEEVERKLNERPRKKHGFLSPNQVFSKSTGPDAGALTQSRSKRSARNGPAELYFSDMR